MQQLESDHGSEARAVSEQIASKMRWRGATVARAGSGCVSLRVRPQEKLAFGGTRGVLASCCRDGGLYGRDLCACVSKAKMGGSQQTAGELAGDVCVCVRMRARGSVPAAGAGLQASGTCIPRCQRLGRLRSMGSYWAD